MGHSEQQQPLAPGTEQRTSIRVVYETLLLMADWDGDRAKFPSYSAFTEVKARDLSATGVGFLSPREPKTEFVLLMLGNPQAKPIFIKARMVYSRLVEGTDGQQYRIGCEFVERMPG